MSNGEDLGEDIVSLDGIRVNLCQKVGSFLLEDGEEVYVDSRSFER